MTTEAHNHFTDPHRCEIMHADGPVSVSQVHGTTVLSFTQISPKLDARAVKAVSGADLEMMVVARVGVPIGKIDEIIDVLQKVKTVTSAAGNA